MLMRHSVLIFAALLACGMPLARVSKAGSRDPRFSPTGILNAAIVILDPARTLTPNAADYTNDFVEITGASGVRVQVSTDPGNGLNLFVRCANAAPPIALVDFLVKTATAPGPGGTTISVYTAITATNQLLWSTTNAPAGSTTVNTDIRIKNLFAYPDPIGAGTTGYTDILTFTVVEI